MTEQTIAQQVPVALFIGREEFLKTLRETLQAERLAVIVGARGVGKTAVAREYARRFASEYQQVLWINASMFSSLLSDALELARRFDLPLEQGQDIASVTVAIQEWASTRENMLVVLDNVIIPPKALPVTKPRPIGGHILLIARDLESDPEAARQLETFLDEHAGQLRSTLAGPANQAQPSPDVGDSLPQLTPGEPVDQSQSTLDGPADRSQPAQDVPADRPAATFLRLSPLTTSEGARLALCRAGLLAVDAALEQAGEEQRQLALELARELHSLPLALELAGGYLRATGSGLQEYLLAFRDDPTEPDNTDAALQIIIPACNLILAHLERARSTVLAVLQVCTLLAPTGIPPALFQQESLRTTLFPEQEEQSAALLRGALRSLLACGLLATRDVAGASSIPRTLEMPPLLRIVLRKLVPEERQRQLREQLLHACLQLALSEANQEQTLPAYVNLAGHIWFLFAQDEQRVYTAEKTAEAFTWAASVLDEQGLVREAEALLDKALNTWARALGSAHPTVAGVQLHLAILNARLQQYVQAESYAQLAITNTSQALGVNHPNVLYSIIVLGQIYQQQRKDQNARLCYEKALSIGERVGLRGHPHYLAAFRLLEGMRK